MGVNRSIPWHVWCMVAATTSSMVGVHWDISWHRSIGRDTFWTPAHVAIYLCGVLAGIASAWMILGATFSKSSPLRATSVRIWGFHGPLGAFAGAWGGLAMLTSAPFDDWWHNAYGLDVKILSPPHMVLAMGMFSVQLAALLLVRCHANNAEGGTQRRLDWLYLYVGGLVLVNMNTLILEYCFRVLMHSGIYYRSIGAALPFFLFAIAAGSSQRWAATKMSLIYMLFWNGMNWILPLFPAEPKLGPVLNPITHFVPSTFSILLVFPALAADGILERMRGRSPLALAFAAGTAFMAVLLAVQWPFGSFLMSPAARNRFFYSHMFDYRTGPNTYLQRFQFFPWEKTSAAFWTNMTLAFALTILLAWMGLHWGRWLRTVRR